MEKEMRVEMRFYRKGKFVGGSFCVFTGTDEELKSVFDEGKIEEEIIEFMAHRAGVRRFDESVGEGIIVNVTEEAESAEN